VKWPFINNQKTVVNDSAQIKTTCRRGGRISKTSSSHYGVTVSFYQPTGYMSQINFVSVQLFQVVQWN